MATEIKVPVFVALRDDATKRLEAQLSTLSTSFGKFTALAGKAAAGLASFGAVVGANFLSGSIDQAKNLERSLLSVDTVFGDLAPRIEKFAASSAKYGLSQSEAAKASVFLGSVLKQSGFSMEETAVQTEKLVRLGADLSATYGYDVQEALLGMTALFRGEYDPIEKFGVAMKQSEINSELAARGLDKLEGAARRFAEQQIRLEFLFQRSADAQGAFARGSGTLYVETEILRATFENMQMQIGTKLTPAITTMMNELQKLIPVVGDQLSAAVEQVDWGKLVTDLANMATFLIENLDTLIELGKVLGTVIGVIYGIKIAIEAATIAQAAFNFVVSKSPYVLAAGLFAAAIPLILEYGKAVRNSMTEQQKASEDARSMMGRQKAIEEGFKRGKKVIDDYTESWNKLRNAIKNFNYSKVTAPAAFGLPGQMGFEDKGGGDGGGGGGGAATESQFKKVQKIIKTYQDRLNKAEEQYLRQKFQLNRDYEEDIKKLREAEVKAQENLLKQSAKRLTDTFANISRATLGDLFNRETTTQLETRVTQLSSRLSLSVTREVQKTTNSTVGELINSLSEKIASARNLISAASNLAAKGFSQTFIEQVIETGADTGMALADAILTASPEQQEALKRNFLELETVSETGMDAVAKALTDKFGLATRELNAQSKLLKDELDDSLVEKQAQLIKTLGDAAWAFSFSIKGIRDEFVSVINDLDGKFGGLGSTIDALLAKMAQLATVNITGPTNKLADATVSQVKVVKGAIDATGIVIDSASDIASTAAYIAERVAAANKYIKSSSSNKAQEASAMAQITDWTSQLRELQTAAKEGQNVSETVININVKTSSDQSVAMVGRTLGNTITKYVTTGGKVLVSGTK